LNWSNGLKYLDATYRWLNEEHLHKNGTALERSEWQFEILHDIPQQGNGNDCGVYTILYGDFRSDNIDVRQIDNIPFHRRRIARNILKGKLFYPLP
jgi:sentrin-specific protease 1